MYTIKSISVEGTYYLSSNWLKNKALWVKENKLEERMLFKTMGGAKTSLKRLLEVMTEYLDNTFSIVEITKNGIKDIKDVEVNAVCKDWITIVEIR